MSTEDCTNPNFDNLSLKSRLNYSSCEDNDKRYFYTYRCDIGYTPAHTMPTNDVICVERNGTSRWYNTGMNEEEVECRLYTELIIGICVVTVLVAIIIAIVCHMLRIKRRLNQQLSHDMDGNHSGSKQENMYISPTVQRSNSIPPHPPLPRLPLQHPVNPGYASDSDDDDYKMPKIGSQLTLASHDYEIGSSSRSNPNSFRSVSPLTPVSNQEIALATVKHKRDSDELSDSDDEGKVNGAPAVARESMAVLRADGSMVQGNDQSEL